jgi:hypothetical protein
MYNKFFTIVIIEILNILKENPNFFELNNEKKSAILKEYKIPNSIKKYLELISFENLSKDIQDLIITINKKKISKENNLLKAVLSYLAEKFSENIYELPSEFHYECYEKQMNLASKIINSDSKLANCLKEIIANHSHQEILNELQTLLNKLLNTPIVLVQSPISLSSDKKIEIKNNLAKNAHQLSVPVFQVNKKLIGGMRIFVNGEVTDNSWLKKINLITTLK